MSKRVPLFSSFSPLFLWTILLSTRESKADFFVHSWEDHYQNKPLTHFTLSGSYYTTTSNFDSNGTGVSPTGLQKYSRIIGDVTLEQGITDQLSLFGRLSWAYINQNSSSRAGSSFGLADQSIGANFKVYETDDADHFTDHFKRRPPSFFMDLQVQADIPAYSNAAADSNLTPYLGDGSTDFTGGTFLNFALLSGSSGSLSSSVGAGYTYRTASFSSAIPWSAAVSYVPYDFGIYGRFILFGIYSLKTDTYENSNSSSGRINVGSGGSYFTGDTNPLLANIKAQIGYKLRNKLEIWLAGSQSVWGQSAPNGFTATFGLDVMFGYPKGNSLRKKDPLFQLPQNNGQSNSGFLRYSLDAHIVKKNDRLNLVKIDKGSQDGIEVGDIFDIFSTNKDGSSGEAIARGVITNLRIGDSAVEITEFYKEVWIDEKFVAKRLIH